MRFSDLPLSPASLTVTSIVAAALGMATMTWSGSAPSRPDATLPVVFEEMTVTAPADEPAVSVTLRPARESWLAGEDVTLEAVIQNDGSRPVVVSAAALYDLAVQRMRSPNPMGLGDVTFVALAEAGASEAIVLGPGETAIRTVKLGADQPFDEPGLYRVSGTWLGGEAPAQVPAFEVLIEASEAIAQKQVRRNPGA